MSPKNKSDIGQIMIQRCIHLARRGWQATGRNPMVGAVITHRDRIIGEGWHVHFGGLHAERNALNNVSAQDRSLLKDAHLYVSLEPCNHHGKTSPCTDAILEAQIPKVTIAALDPNPLMNGQSVEYLRQKGVTVDVRDDVKSATHLIAPFRAMQTYHRPYIVLKYAQSKDGFIGQTGQQVWLSNTWSRWATHRLRGQMSGIMVGTNTALIDNPLLTNRLDTNGHPRRILLDRTGRIPASHQVRSDQHRTLIFTTVANYKKDRYREVITLTSTQWSIEIILQGILDQGIYSVIVEGGAALLNDMINKQLWDQCHLYKTQQKLKEGIKAPILRGQLIKTIPLGSDNLMIINRL